SAMPSPAPAWPSSNSPAIPRSSRSPTPSTPSRSPSCLRRAPGIRPDPERRGSVEGRSRNPSDDAKATVALGGDHEKLALGERLAGQRLDGHAVADQDEIADGRPLAHPLPHGRHLLRLSAAVPEEVPQRVPALGPTEGQLRGLQAAAPGARQD